MVNALIVVQNASQFAVRKCGQMAVRADQWTNWETLNFPEFQRS
jgi:hypothetical protein